MGGQDAPKDKAQCSWQTGVWSEHSAEQWQGLMSCLEGISVKRRARRWSGAVEEWLGHKKQPGFKSWLHLTCAVS